MSLTVRSPLLALSPSSPATLFSSQTRRDWGERWSLVSFSSERTLCPIRLSRLRALTSCTLALASAAASISTPFCTAYDTLGPSGLAHAINQPSVVTIFSNGELLGTVLKILPDCPSLKIIVYDGEPPANVLAELKAKEGIRVVSLDEVEKLGADKGEVKSVPPKRDDIAAVMYTSGSTGTPKGVVLTHGNLSASIGAVKCLLLDIVKDDDCYLAFLPLAHVRATLLVRLTYRGKLTCEV